MSDRLNELCKESHLLDFLLNRLSKRPGMYLLGGRSLSDLDNYSLGDLNNFIAGWKLHRLHVEDTDQFAIRFFDDFHSFVQQKFSEERLLGWEGVILEHVEGRQKQVGVFWEMLSEFALLDTAS